MAINSLSSASKGLSGLASGMDTQSMVDAMLSGTQAKIDKQKQQKTVLGYKQTMYRDIWSSLSSLQKNYTGYDKNSMRYSDFYNTMNAVTKSTAFKVRGSSEANAGKTQIDAIHQLAKSATIRSSFGVGSDGKEIKVSGPVSGTLNIGRIADGQTLDIKLDGVTKTINMPKATAGGATLTEEQFVTQLNESIQRAFGNGVTASYDSTTGQLSFVAADDSREFVVSGTADSMGVLGIPSGTSNKLNTLLKLGDSNFGIPLSGEKFEFSINGEKFSFTADQTIDSIMGTINRSNAGVKVRYSALDDKFVMESTVSGKGATIKMEQTQGNLLTAMFGAVKGGNSITGSQQFVYGEMTGKLGGFPDYTAGDIISADNKTLMEGKLKTYEEWLNKYTEKQEMTFELTVDGTKVKVSLPKREPTDPADPDSPLKEYKITDLVKAINDNADLKAKGVQVKMQTGTADDGSTVFTGGMTLTANTGVKVELNEFTQNTLGLAANNGKLATSSDKLAALGGSGKHNVALAWQNADGTVGTSNLQLTGDLTMEQAAQKIQDALVAAGNPGAKVEFSGDDASKGRFRIFGVDIPMTVGIRGAAPGDPSLFGQSFLEFNSKSGTTLDGTPGQNAILDINGVRVERNSNDFTIDGVGYELQEVFNSTANKDGTFSVTDAKAAAEVTVTRDTDQIVDGLKKFIEDYNKLLDKAWGLLKQDAEYRDYPPLTDKQKEAMSDREVELWEKKSQQGLLRGDDTIEGIMDAMRRTLLNKPAGSKYSLAELGISTGYDLDKGFGGKLEFGVDGENKLREILSQEPGEVERLFTGDDGLFTALNKVFDGVTTASSNDPKGQKDYQNLSLVDLAGRPGYPDTSSSIYNQITDINKNLENLNVKYKSEYTRYWKQYSQMEQLISNMNSQSSWLSQQFQ